MSKENPEWFPDPLTDKGLFEEVYSEAMQKKIKRLRPYKGESSESYRSRLELESYKKDLFGEKRYNETEPGKALNVNKEDWRNWGENKRWGKATPINVQRLKKARAMGVEPDLLKPTDIQGKLVKTKSHLLDYRKAELRASKTGLAGLDVAEILKEDAVKLDKARAADPILSRVTPDAGEYIDALGDIRKKTNTFKSTSSRKVGRFAKDWAKSAKMRGKGLSPYIKKGDDFFDIAKGVLGKMGGGAKGLLVGALALGTVYAAGSFMMSVNDMGTADQSPSNLKRQARRTPNSMNTRF